MTDRVTSPTFTVGHRYAGRIRVAHLDLYRFAARSAAEWGDLEAVLRRRPRLRRVAGGAGDELPAPRARVRMRHDGEGRRVIEIEADRTVLEEAYGEW